MRNEIGVIRIEYSHKIHKRYMDAALALQEKYHPGHPVLMNRSRASLKLEWACHNFLYQMHIARERTAAVDLEYPQAWYLTALYCIGGVLVWPLIK